jgi:mercuric ion binding protein
MKPIFIFLFTLVMALNANAQIKPLEKAVIKMPALQCEECAALIEKYMVRQNGIRAIKTNYRKKIVTISWLTDRLNLDDIRVALANLGFDADDVAAEPGAAKRLPECCRKTPASAPPK